MKLCKLNNILRILFIVLSALFLLTACSSDDDGGTVTPSQSDPRAAAEEQRQCWQKEILGLFYQNIGDQSKNIYNELTSENLFQVVLMGFTIWMAFQILRHISSPAAESSGEFWTKIVRKAFLCAFCGILASSTTQIYYVINNFIFPIYYTLLELTSEILNITGKDPDATVKAISISSSFGDDQNDEPCVICEVYKNSVTDAGCKFQTSANANFSASSFPQEPLNMMGCMACAISDRLSVGYDVSVRLLKMGSLTAFMVGCFLMVCFTIAKLGFVFYLVDSIFRLNIIIIILPFLIMAYPFEQIRKWAKTGFLIILSSSAIMLCLGIIVSLSILAMQKLITSAEFKDVLGKEEQYVNFGATAMSLIFMGFLIVKSTGMAVELAGKMTFKNDTGFQKKVQQLVALVAKGLFALVTFGGGKVATTIIDHIEKLRQIREKVQEAKAKANKVRNKINSLAGRK